MSMRLPSLIDLDIPTLVPTGERHASVDPLLVFRRRAVDAAVQCARALTALEPLLRDANLTTTEHDAFERARRICDQLLRLVQPAPGENHPPGGASDGAPDDPRLTRILVVDDEPLVRTLLKRQLEDLGLHVLEASNGREAFDLASRDVPDIVVSDIDMPQVDGLELLRLLKDTPATSHVPVIIVSSLDELSIVTKCIEQGAEDHIAKPFEPALLRARVAACLDRKRLRDAELEHLRRIGAITAAAEAVERDTYVPGSLRAAAEAADDLGRLARVFDRLVAGLKLREERLQHRVRDLKRELEGAMMAGGDADQSLESPFSSGEVLASRYEILGRLGSGGMGMVYRARDLELGEDVAVKVVRSDVIARDPTLVDRFKSEIRLARRISHRNVVRTHDLGEWHGTMFITMEYVHGITLADLVDKRGRLTSEATIAIGIQLAEALAVAHECGIVHRDIKPANLLVDESGVLKVMDFGIARSEQSDLRLTAGGFLVGTPYYMAPEQLMGGTADASSDLFSAGIAMYECLTGQIPFTAESPTTLLRSMLDGGYVRLREYPFDVPSRLEAIVDQLLCPQARERPASARALANALMEIEGTS